MSPENAPLDGITVVDFTRVLSGPYCTMLLADMGARVIKIEQPGRGDDTRAWGPPFVNGESAYFLSINRNKESLTLDLKHPAARAVLERLLARADVLVENFRPGTMDRLGLGYEALAPRYPRLVYCSISGFGQTGPRREEAGYDAVMQAEGGLMSITGAAGRSAVPPWRRDLRHRQRHVRGAGHRDGAPGAGAHGRGQRVDIGMLDSTAALLTYQAGIYFATGTTPGRHGQPPSDDRAVRDIRGSRTATSSSRWERRSVAAVLPVIERRALADDERFATNRDARGSLRCAAAAARRAAAMRRARRMGCGPEGRRRSCGSVREIAEVLEDPQLDARQMIETSITSSAGAIRVLGIPIKLSDTPERSGRAADARPAHRTYSAKDCGLSAE